MQMDLETVSAKLTEMGITDLEEQAGVLAQLKAESGFNPRSESLNYTPERLQKTFPKYFKTVKDAEKALDKGQEYVANVVYGGRMGNAKNEGFKYRGRGLIQLTGKDNYKRYGDKIGVDLVSNPDLANDPEIAFELAVTYLLDRSPDLKDPVATTKAVGPARLKEKTQQRAELQKQYIERLQGIVPQAAPMTHTVQQGEWLSKIAADRGIDLAELKAANPDIDPDQIQPGQVLQLPAAKGATSMVDDEGNEFEIVDLFEDVYDYGKSQIMRLFS